MTDGAAARAYHESTKHSRSSVHRPGHLLDWENKPDPFKTYRALQRVPLPEDLPPTEVPALDAVAGRVIEPAPGPDAAALARLLRLGAGVRHRVRFPDGDVFWFRTYASAGALYPVEVYVICGDLDGLEAGVYHFQAEHRCLVRLRDGDHRGHVVRAAASEPAAARAPAILVLTGIPWRTAWKYTERGYRHLFWDAGMILANVLALAVSARMPARVVLGFADRDVERLLGLDGRREFPLCLLPVGQGPEVSPAAEPLPEVDFDVAPLSPREYAFELITSTNDAGRLEAGEVRGWRSTWSGDGPGPTEAEPDVAARGEVGAGDGLEQVIRRRGSARLFERGAIPEDVLAAILDRATAGIPTDLAPEGARLVRPYVVANAVDGLAAGAYVFANGAFRLLREGSFRRTAGELCLEQPLGADAAVTHFLMVDLDPVLRTLGDRGYRWAQLEGGTAAGRIYLGAYAHRFGATGLTFYDDDVTSFFSPEAERESCMLVTAVGVSPRLRRRS